MTPTTWIFRPTLVLPTGRLRLPRPIVQCRVQEAYDAAQFKVPLRDGDRWFGRSRGGIDIALRGQLAQNGAEPAFTEGAMFDLVEEVREALRLGDPEQTYGLGLLEEDDPGTPASARPLRGFVGCSTVRLEYDLSDRALYGYSLLIHASDARLQTGSLTS